MPPIANGYVFTRTQILSDKMLTAFHNQFKVVASRLYTDKNGKLPDGYTYTLRVLFDDYDYGVDKEGNKRDDNRNQTFDVTVLSREHKAKKGDIVRLVDFVDEYSYAIGFDLILRFKDIKILQPQGAKPNA